MKRCGSCFRYIEDTKDARKKGLKPRYIGIAGYHYKPRKRVKPRGIGYNCPEDICKNHPACRAHRNRWNYNIEIWYVFRFRRSVDEWIREKIRVPLGGLRKPIPIGWKDGFDGMTDTIIKNGEPVCLRCKEYPYSIEQCVFCGQKFIKED